MRVADQDVFMPAFAGGLSDADIAQVSNYVIYQFGGKQGKVTPGMVAKQRGQ